MTYKQFILLLCLYACLVGGGPAAEKFLALPREAKPNRNDLFGQRSKLFLATYVTTNGLLIGCGIVGFVGMFFRWNLAPWLFALGIACKNLVGPYFNWTVRSSWEQMCDNLELLLDGAILTLVFFGPARHLFFVAE